MSILYRGSEDGFGAKDFHDRCDDKGKTLCIIKNSLVTSINLDITLN